MHHPEPPTGHQPVQNQHTRELINQFKWNITAGRHMHLAQFCIFSLCVCVFTCVSCVVTDSAVHKRHYIHATGKYKMFHPSEEKLCHILKLLNETKMPYLSN